jgi:hypothetical protein
MARLGRVVVLDVAHRVAQRGNRRQETFFDEEDYAAYLALQSEKCAPPSDAANQNDGRNKQDVSGVYLRNSRAWRRTVCASRIALAV